MKYDIHLEPGMYVYFFAPSVKLVSQFLGYAYQDSYIILWFTCPSTSIWDCTIKCSYKNILNTHSSVEEFMELRKVIVKENHTFKVFYDKGNQQSNDTLKDLIEVVDFNIGCTNGLQLGLGFNKSTTFFDYYTDTKSKNHLSAGGNHFHFKQLPGKNSLLDTDFYLRKLLITIQGIALTNVFLKKNHY